MTGTTAITIEQFDAIIRLREELPTSVVMNVVLTPGSLIRPEATYFVRVGFHAGWGSISYDVTEDGESAQVNFGHSEISISAGETMAS